MMSRTLVPWCFLILCVAFGYAGEHRSQHHNAAQGEDELIQVMEHEETLASERDTPSSSSSTSSQQSSRPLCVPDSQPLPVYYNLERELLTDAVDRITAPSEKDFWELYVKANKPVIITGAMDKWTAYREWIHDDYIRTHYGGLEIHAESSRTNKFGYEAGQDWRRLELTWNQSLDQYLPSAAGERGFVYISTEVPEEMEKDFTLPPFLPCHHNNPEHHYTDTGLWMGGGGQESLLHNDPSDNLLMVIDGRKQMIIFPPQQATYLYEKIPNDRKAGKKGGLPKWDGKAKRVLQRRADEGEWDEENFASRVSPVNLQHPDYSLHPLLRQAQGQLVNLQRGDILFLPKLWYHQVWSYCRHLSINHWFDISGLNNLVLDKPELWTWPAGRIVKYLQRLDAKRQICPSLS